MVQRLQELTLEQFSNAFIKYQKMPRSWKVLVLDEKNDRMKRSDAGVKVHALRAPRVPRVASGDKTKTLLEAAASALSTDIQARRWSLQLHVPSDAGRGYDKVDPRTKISNLLRQEDSRQSQIAIDDEVDGIAPLADEHVLEAHDSADEPETVVPRAYLSALVLRYGPSAVKDAIRALEL